MPMTKEEFQQTIKDAVEDINDPNGDFASSDDLVKKARELAIRFADDDAREDLDAQDWGEHMPPWNVLDLCDRIEQLERDLAAWRERDVENVRRYKAQLERAEQLERERDELESLE